MHDESSPIYDQHVLKFFGEKPPTAPQAERISWYVNFLTSVATAYAAWGEDERIGPTLERLKARDARLVHCDVVRLVDFLVWKVGNQKLLTTA